MLKKGILLSEKKEMNFGHRYWKINVVLFNKNQFVWNNYTQLFEL